MSNEQHTPGPWRPGTIKNGEFHFDIYAGSSSIVATARRLGPGAGDIKRSLEHSANAALIASAPTLAAENKRLREAASELLVAIGLPLCSHHLASPVDALRAALAGGDA